MKTRDVMEGLLDLRDKFDEGCKIYVGDDSITVVGVCYSKDEPEAESVRVHRTYTSEFGYTPDSDQVFDTVKDLIEKIDKDLASWKSL